MKFSNIALLTATGNKLLESTEVQGVLKLLDDISFVVGIGGPVVCTIAAAFFVGRRSMADEQDSKMWERRAKCAGVCAVVMLLVGGIIKLIGTYFGLDIQV